jgi:phosphoglycerate dehydrogenase-like enzyme
MTTTTVLHHTRPETLDAIRAQVPDVEFVPVPTEGPLDPSIQGDVMLTTAIGAPSLPEALDRGVRWVHTIGTGVDRFPLDAIRQGQVLTCSRGASAIPIAEWTLAMMLAFEKQLPDAWIHEPPARWHTATLGGLYRKQLAVLGLGGIGVEVARRALAFGMEVRGLRRTLRPAPLDGIEMVTSSADAVAGADHVVVAAPSTAQTRHLVDAALLAQMKPGAHLVNIARGNLVDQDALRAALDDGHLGGASLDVVDPEPLPAGHWLYTHPKVHVSPHISWSMPASYSWLYETFLENLRRWQAGEPLEGVVDLALGY